MPDRRRIAAKAIIAAGAYLHPNFYVGDKKLWQTKRPMWHRPRQRQRSSLVWTKSSATGSSCRTCARPGDSRTAAAKMTKGTMADLKTLFSEEAAQCRRLAEIATEQGIKEKLLEMAARFQALADGDNDEQ